MKTLIKTIIAASVVVALSGCKKHKLEGEQSVLTGTWTSTYTINNCGFVAGQPIDPSFKLELIEKGKYKLYSGSRTVEHGILLNADGYVIFKCNKKESYLHGRRILKFNSDTLNIDRNMCEDDYFYRFVKNK